MLKAGVDVDVDGGEGVKAWLFSSEEAAVLMNFQTCMFDRLVHS